ncbi:tRNA-dihydrouridine synthase [bacterium]|nr:tRNA-dihydrouridine synthase [bacterium]
MNKHFWNEFKTPIVGLAPMDGYSDSAFRRVCKSINPNIVTITEFTSADGLSHGAKRLKEKLKFHPDEQPVIAQIFGNNTETFIRATKVCEDMGFSGIDINMGCPSKRVVRSEHGVALRKKPDLACKLVEAVAKNTSLPVSVKTRLGWNNADGLEEFATAIQDAGADMLCIHARTYKEPYNVPANFEPLYALKQNLSIPLIINGGITSLADGHEKLGNCDGFYIGQASFGNPWVFTTEGAPKTFREKIPTILNHTRWLIEAKGDVVGTREIRKHLLQYIKGFRGAKSFRSQVVHVGCYADIVAACDAIAKAESQLTSLLEPAL